MANVGFVGMGKLGLPVALAIESRGHNIIGYDVNPAVEGYLRDKHIPFQEEGIQPLLEANKVVMAESVGKVVVNSDVIFVPIQTPHDPKYEGITRLPEDRQDFDYEHLKQGLGSIVDACGKLGVNRTVVVISTCLPGTYERELKPLLSDNVDYVYNPFFIAMGTVVQDFLNPEAVLLGTEDGTPHAGLQAFYHSIYGEDKTFWTDITTAEGIKVSYNTWITAKTVIANLWGELAHKTGMNFSDIRNFWELATDRLISSKYMDAGVGDGGGCHPRDNIALSWLAEEIGLSHNVFEDLMHAREDHMQWIGREGIDRAKAEDLPLIILGKSFKPETNIQTGSASLLMANLIGEEHPFQHYEDIPETCAAAKAVYIIGTKHKRYVDFSFPQGSTVIDPFGIIPDQPKVTVVRLGRR